MDRQPLSSKLGVWRSLSSQEAINGFISGKPGGANNSPGNGPTSWFLTFHDLHLFRRALIHRSYVNEHPEVLQDNERLEFLGDAVLDLLVAVWLYHHFPEMAEGALTRMRAALVGTNNWPNSPVRSGSVP